MGKAVTKEFEDMLQDKGVEGLSLKTLIEKKRYRLDLWQ